MVDKSIGIDVSYWRSEGNRGIGNMTENLVKHLVSSQGLKPHLFSNRREEAVEQFCIEASLKYHVIPLPFPIYEQFALPLAVRLKKISLFHHMGNTGSIFLKSAPSSIITICDTIFWEENLLTWLRRGKYGNFYRAFVARHQKKLGYHYSFISEYTKTCYIKDGLKAKSLYRVIYLSGGRDDAEPAVFLTLMPQNRYICAMGARDPRKNSVDLIRAFIDTNIASVFKLKLKIFGFDDPKQFLKMGGFSTKKLDAYGIEILGFQTDYDKEVLIKNSVGFVYLSKSEGFGIPIIEAEKLGKQCLVASTTSCGEIAGPLSVKVNPNSYEDIVLCLKQFAELVIEPQTNVRVVEEIVRHANRFSWHQMAKETVNFYRALL